MEKHEYVIMVILFVFIVAVGLASCIASPSEASTAEDVSKDVSSGISEPSDVDESTVSEPSETSAEADPSEPSESSVEDVSKAPEETSTPAETSKVEEPSQPDEPSEPEDTSTTPSEIVKPNEESQVEETSKDETSKEENVIHGDTPVEIVVNGEEHTVETYEDAKELLTLEDLETAEAGCEIVITRGGRTFTFACNGDGTYTASYGGNESAQFVYDAYISQWCSHCGQRKGDGANGTCVRYLKDTNCHQCGEVCIMLECHTCDD